MSSETWQEIAGLLALLPWIAFVVAIVWCEVLELLDNARTAQADERARLPRSDKRPERTPRTSP
jgi:hypothetical protein